MIPTDDVFGRLGDILRPEPLTKSKPCAKCEGSGLVEIDPYGTKAGPMLFDCDRCFGTGLAVEEKPYNVNEDGDD